MRNIRQHRGETGAGAGDGLARAFAGWLIAFALIVLASLAVIDRPLVPQPILPVKAETVTGEGRIGLPRTDAESILPFARIGGGYAASR